MTEKKVFVRKATGLVREIGFITAVLIVVCNMVGLGWQKRLFQFTGPRIVPENEYVMGLPPVVMSFILVGIVVLFTVWVLAILGASMPRSGGGYVYISRILHPAIGYVASWLEYFSIAVSYGLIGTAVFEGIMIYAWMAGWGVNWATPEFLLLGGMAIVALFAIIACFGVRMTGLLLHVIFWVPAIITIVLYGLLLTATPDSLNAGIQNITGVTSSTFTDTALSLGMATAPADYWSAVAYASLGTFWAYIGFGAATFVAGEIKEAAKDLPKQLFTANVFVILLYITISFLVARAAMMVGQVGNYSFFSSYSWLSYGSSEGQAYLSSISVGKAWMPNIAGFIASGMGQTWILALIPIFAALWVANDIPPFILTSSRIIFAMAFDRVLPEKLAEVNERWHTPIYAVIVTMLVAFIGNFAESNIFASSASSLYLGSGNVVAKFLNDSGGVAATDIWDALFFFLCAVAGMIFVFRRKDIYERSSFKAGGPMVVTLIGTIATVANIWFLWQIVQGWPWDFPDGGAWTAWVATLIIIILSLLVYYYYRTKGKRVGVDYSTIYAEIPPE
ncbi:APC family permease [Candidatus Bathyarchaeota archaeon]|nr:APC family permease [Candidatus Bathyarchaeota archaeon]